MYRERSVPPRKGASPLPCYTLQECREQGKQRISCSNQATRRYLYREGKVPSVVLGWVQVVRREMNSGKDLSFTEHLQCTINQKSKYLV